jgi:two-component system chemotaxis response regulator CheY
MRKKVLIVDDSRVARMSLRKVIEEFGHEVVFEAQDGVEGIESYKKLKPDIVICDIEMPNLDGNDLLKQIKQYDSDANVAIVSSVTNKQTLQKLFMLGALEIIKKPFKKVQIKKILDNL